MYTLALSFQNLAFWGEEVTKIVFLDFAYHYNFCDQSWDYFLAQLHFRSSGEYVNTQQMAVKVTSTFFKIAM